MKTITTSVALLIAVTAVASTASASVLDYKILINGAEAPLHMIPAGTHTIRIEARVTENDLAPDTPGGLLQSAFNLVDSANVTLWEDIAGGFIGGSDGNWDSTANAAFDSHFQGVLQDTGTDVIAETGAIAPGDFTTQFADIGAGVFSLITEGNFDWDGTPTTIDLLVANPTGGDVVVAGLNGSAVVGTIPDTVNGATTMLGIPEPCSMILGGIGLLVASSSRRRRQG